MFQKTVSTVAIIILIIALCIIGIALYRQKFHSKYPPVIANCPDYWDVSGNFCINSKRLGNPSCQAPMDFTQGNFASSNGPCIKYKWARSCNLTWDGISDNVDLCP